MRSLDLVLVLGLAGLGCGGSVIERNRDHTASGSGGSGDTVTASTVSVNEASSSLATGGSTGDVWGVGGSTADMHPAGPVGAGGAGPAGAGGAGGEACTSVGETYESMTIVVEMGGLPVLGCSAKLDPKDADFEIQGTVTQSSATSFIVSTCPPNTMCQDSPVTIHVAAAPAVAFAISTGAFVDVHVQEQLTGMQTGCTDMIAIQNLPIWQGVHNPVDRAEFLWLAAGDGTTEVLSGVPLSVSAVYQCTLPLPGGCEDTDYFLRFTNADAGSVNALMGQSANLEGWQVHDMRSFTSCSQAGFYPGHWGYWIMGRLSYLPPG